MEYLTLDNLERFLSLLLIASIVFGVIARAFGWKKGAMIADELQDGFSDARDHLFKAVSASPVDREGFIQKAAISIAAGTSGIKADDVRPIVRDLVKGAIDGKQVTEKGITMSLDPATGNVKIDPSGAISKSWYKISKWLKKIF